MVDRAEDCNYSGICGKPVVTPEIGLSPGSETLYRTNPEVQRPLSEGEGGIDTSWVAWMVRSRYQHFQVKRSFSDLAASIISSS